MSVSFPSMFVGGESGYDFHLRDFKWYGPYGKNPALREVATGGPMHAHMHSLGVKVAETWAATVRKDTTDLSQQAEVYTEVGGAYHDRAVAVVLVASEYAGANEFGRHEYNPYAGDHALRNALYAHFGSD